MIAMSKFKTAVGIAIFSVLHFAATFVALIVTLAIGSKRFEFGGDATIVEIVSEAVTKVLIFPGYQLYIAADINSDAFEWLTVIGNSILWGAALFGVFVIILRVRRQFLFQARSVPESN
jgi:hypothetical protein